MAAKQVPTAQAIDSSIQKNIDRLRKPGVLTVRPGFEIADHQLTGKSAIVATVHTKKKDIPKTNMLPAAIGNIPVDVREATPQFLREHENGVVMRVSCVLSDVGRVLDALPVQALARAGSGVCYGYFEQAPDPSHDLRYPAIGTSAVEFAPQKFRESSELWPQPGNDFGMMKKIKEMFDPHGLLNCGRLYGRI